MATTKLFKKLLKWIIIIFMLIGIGYAGFKVYHLAVDHITKKIGKEVSKGIIDTVNPFKLPEKIFGHKHKK